MKTVLVLNPGDGTGLNFARCLREADSWRTIGLHTARSEVHFGETDTLLLSWWRSPEHLLGSVNRVSSTESVDVLYVADTGRELDAVSRLRERLEVGTLLPDLDDHLVMEDKWESWKRLEAAGCPVPRTILSRKRSDLAELLKRHGRIWLRRRRGSAGAGSVPTSSLSFASSWLDEYDGWGEFTAAECLSKRTATMSGLWFDGELLRSQLRERVAWGYADLSASGVTGITGVQRTIADDGLHQQAVDAIRAVCRRPHGAIGVDFTYTDDGRPLVTEVQPARFYTSIHFMARLGLNFASDWCNLAVGGREALGEPRLNPCQTDMYWVKGVERLPKLMTRQDFAGAYSEISDGDGGP